MIRTFQTDGRNHTHIYYYDTELRSWSAPSFEFDFGSDSTMQNVYLVRPPVNLKGYLSTHKDTVWAYFTKMLNSYYLMEKISPVYVQNQFQIGIDSAQMKQWLLYS